MVNIKVGDLVKRVRRLDSYIWTDFLDSGYKSDDIFQVTAVSKEDFLSINIQDWLDPSAPEDKYPFGADNFEIVEDLTEPKEDSLPPVQDSVSYEGEGPVYAFENVPLLVETLNGSIGLFLGESCVSLSPDDALDLAHDITRMALQIKREERDQD